jgi:hypothetical protein
MASKSWNKWKMEFEVGEKRFLETTLDGYKSLMRTVHNPSRLNKKMKASNMDFSMRMFTAIPASGLAEPTYLLCVERIN